MPHEKKRPDCRLRHYRRYWGLSQEELAPLLGFKSHQHVSRLEKAERTPTMESALACQVLFDVAPAAMFPHAYDAVEDWAAREILKRHEALSDTTSPKELRKRQLYDLAMERAGKDPSPATLV